MATSLTRKEPRGSDNNPEVDDWPNTQAPCRIDVTDVSALEGNTLRRDVPALLRQIRMRALKDWCAPEWSLAHLSMVLTNEEISASFTAAQ